LMFCRLGSISVGLFSPFLYSIGEVAARSNQVSVFDLRHWTTLKYQSYLLLSWSVSADLASCSTLDDAWRLWSLTLNHVRSIH
jgi:hypothetical protein